jgi:ATP-dependent Clp protease protease subunit
MTDLLEPQSDDTGQDMKTIEHDTDRDNFFGAGEAVNYGLVDKVLVSRAEVGA